MLLCLQLKGGKPFCSVHDARLRGRYLSSKNFSSFAFPATKICSFVTVPSSGRNKKVSSKHKHITYLCIAQPVPPLPHDECATSIAASHHVHNTKTRHTPTRCTHHTTPPPCIYVQSIR